MRASVWSASGLPALSFGFRFCCLILAWQIIVTGTPAAAQTPPIRSLEYKVKAAYLFNFAKYTEWPERAFSSPEAPIVIGILGSDPFGDLLESTISDRRVGTRNVVVKRSRRVED